MLVLCHSPRICEVCAILGGALRGSTRVKLANTPPKGNRTGLGIQRPPRDRDAAGIVGHKRAVSMGLLHHVHRVDLLAVCQLKHFLTP